MSVKPGAIGHVLTANPPPSDWTVTTVRSLGRIVGGATPDSDEAAFWRGGTIPWATPTDITALTSRYIADTETKITDAGLKGCAAQLLPAGSILFTSRATIGAKAINTVPMATNQGFASFLPASDVNRDFLFNYLNLLIPAFMRLGSGTTFLEVSKRDMRKVQCALPPPDEQAAIARILDAADTAIERARVAVEKATVLGRNLRETLVVDADWPLERLGGFIADGPTNGVYRPESDYGVEGTPIIRIDSFGVGTIRNIAGLRRVRLPLVLRDRYTTGEGDILINRVNSLDFIGKAALVPPMPEMTIFESNMMRLRLRGTLRADYLIEVLLSSVAKRHWLMRAKAAVNQASINQRDVASLRIPVPSSEKQTEIAAIMAQQRRVLESVSARLTALERLKRGLMQDLLTGRVRVKPSAASLATTV